MTPIRVLIVDDHKIVRQGLRELLSDVGELEVCDDVATLNEARGAIIKYSPSVILQDISLKNNESGISFTKELKKDYPQIKVIALTMYSEPSMIKGMLRSGAKGYLLKDSSKKELVDAILAVDKGQTYYSGRVQDSIISSFVNNTAGKSQAVPKLSRREKEILSLILEELTTSEIAQRLSLSVGTIETHRRNMLSKLGVRNTAGLVRVAYENGLVD